MIITVQAVKEKPNDVKTACEQLGIRHFWIELNGANQDLMNNQLTLKYLRKRVRELLEILNTSQEVALVHCSAGLHRTGTLGFTLLRLGSQGALGKAEAYLALKTLREDTWAGVGDWRIDLAEENLVAPILEERPEDPDIPDDCPSGELAEGQAQAASAGSGE